MDGRGGKAKRKAGGMKARMKLGSRSKHNEPTITHSLNKVLGNVMNVEPQTFLFCFDSCKH